MSGTRRSLYLSTRRVINLTVGMERHITFANYVQNFIQHHVVKVTSI